MKKFSSAYFPLFVCFFNMQFPRNLGFFYWRKKAAFFSYTAVCLLAFLNVLLPWISPFFCGKGRIPQCFYISLHTQQQQHSSSCISSSGAETELVWSLAGNLWATACRCWAVLCCRAWCGGHRWVYREILSFFPPAFMSLYCCQWGFTDIDCAV